MTRRTDRVDDKTHLVEFFGTDVGTIREAKLWKNDEECSAKR